MTIQFAKKAKSINNSQSSKLTLIENINQITFVSNLKKGEILSTFKLSNSDVTKLEISKALVFEAMVYGLNIVTDDFYMENLFEKIYFSKLEIQLGYKQRVKHTQLKQTIDYYIDVCIENENVSLTVIANDLKPQILSNPKDWLARVKLLDI